MGGEEGGGFVVVVVVVVVVVIELVVMMVMGLLVLVWGVREAGFLAFMWAIWGCQDCVWRRSGFAIVERLTRSDGDGRYSARLGGLPAAIEREVS